MTDVYINGIGNVSPQMTFDGDSFLAEIPSATRFTAIEPDYSAWIDAKALRRMSRVIKMGVAAAERAIKEAGAAPDGIITGTGYGCLDDTGIFLSKMVASDEQSLNPTPFIQSTHNSIGSQIGLIIQCQGYNQTYVQGSFSWETSLLDAMMAISQNASANFLVGGVDEITEISYAILRRFGLFRRGAKPGEGAAYFSLSGRPGNNVYARLAGVKMIYKPSGEEEIAAKAKSFLKDCGVDEKAIDVILLGTSGDPRADAMTAGVVNKLCDRDSVVPFKNLCGEYPTASTFATWLGADLLKTQRIPEGIGGKRRTEVNNILVFNSCLGTHFSLILLRRA